MDHLLGGHDPEIYRAARSTHTNLPIVIKDVSGTGRPDTFLDDLSRKTVFHVSIFLLFENIIFLPKNN